MDDQSLPGDAPRTTIPSSSGAHLIAPNSICRGCEYDLTGLSAPGLCPECGLEFTELAGDERIELDWSCLRCGYSLLGLQRKQKCSECGMSASISIDPTLFRFQPGEYRKRVRSGALFAGLGMLSIFVIPLLVVLVSLVWLANLPAGSVFADLVMTMAGFAAIGLFSYGWFRILSAPPVTMALTGRQLRIASIARWSLIVWLAVTVVTAILDLTATASAAGSGFGAAALPLSQLISLLSFGMFFVCGLIALKPLFLRARSTGKRPGGVATVTLWVGVVALAGFVLSAMAIVAAAMSTFGGGLGIGGAAVGLGLVTILTTLCAFVTFFCYLGTTESLRSALKRVERDIAVAHRNALRPSQPRTGETPGGFNPNIKAT
jgi:hypothetical protein